MQDRTKYNAQRRKQRSIAKSKLAQRKWATPSVNLASSLPWVFQNLLLHWSKQWPEPFGLLHLIVHRVVLQGGRSTLAEILMQRPFEVNEVCEVSGSFGEHASTFHARMHETNATPRYSIVEKERGIHQKSFLLLVR